jgi:hypothetical protein
MAKFIRYADLAESMEHFATRDSGETSTVTVWMHDSGLISNHSLPCYVCFDKPAVRTDTQTEFGGTFATTFQPCHSCQDKGWRLSRRARPWWAFWRPLSPEGKADAE